MTRPSSDKAAGGARCRPVDLRRHWNWPRKTPRTEFWLGLAKRVRGYPAGLQHPWGIRFRLSAAGRGPRVILVDPEDSEVRVPLGGTATHVCVLHEWVQQPEEVRQERPREGLVVGEYELAYADGGTHIQPVRARFETGMVESPGPAWLAVGCCMPEAMSPAGPVPENVRWGWLQHGLKHKPGSPLLLYALPNPHPARRLAGLVIRSRHRAPLIVAGITLYVGTAHPLRHLPRRTYRVRTPAGPPRVVAAEADLGTVVRTVRTSGPRDRAWLESPYAGMSAVQEPERRGEDLLEIEGAPDASVAVRLADKAGRRSRRVFSLGEAFSRGRSRSDGAALEVLGRRRQWMTVRVVDEGTGLPTASRVHLSGPRGDYIAPYGHHEQVNANWFEDYGADVQVGGRNYAYVPGEFAVDMPVGDVYVELNKGFEYAPVRRRVRIEPGVRTLDLSIGRFADFRSRGWVTADTHVHFISPHTAWLEGEAEGVNVVNLLASQWGRLFTNVGDITGKPGVVEGDTIVYVGTENRNHMLGHMSMLGTQGKEPVFPMCCGGPGEAWIGDPDFVTLAEWALENRRKGGVVIRPHYPYCGHTEDPIPILKGLVDALEINMTRQGGFPVQEWYRYLNSGYRVAVCGGTDKMGAYCALGWLRTYAELAAGTPFTYDAWSDAVRAGRTVSTNGPLMSFTVEGRGIGGTIAMPAGGGTVEVEASAECAWPLGVLEIVRNGTVVGVTEAPRGGSRKLAIAQRVELKSSGWIAARCYGPQGLPSSFAAAHTSPVYVTCGQARAFDGPAVEHMLALVEGGREYLETLAAFYDEATRRRMVRLFDEARAELGNRLIVEGHAHPHHGSGPYHAHGHVDGHSHGGLPRSGGTARGGS